MSRGDLVIVAALRDYAKPRPAVIVRSNAIVICQITAEWVEADFRIAIEPWPETGLRTRFQVMAHKPVTIRRERIGRSIGRIWPRPPL
jgi:mRNA interferase MazF